MSPRVYLEFLGCRLNAAETEGLARRFAGVGYEVVDAPAVADVIVVNSCAVTTQAARSSRRRLRALHRENPNAELAVTGCWATGAASQAAQLPGVRWVIPNIDKGAVVAEIAGREADPAPWAPGRWGHTRAFLGVQDGCDHACTYCVTRLLRGPARSRPLTPTVAEVQRLVEQGAQEVVLTGVSLGSYGRDLAPPESLTGLAGAILADTDLPRLRLSSIEPWDVDAALLRLWEDRRLCRQLHLPLQSGSDAVLKRMGRPITVADYTALTDEARAFSEEIALTTDILAGFPGETDRDFRETLALVERVGFARLHVFPYSERAGTPAVRLPEPVPHSVRKERAAELRTLGRRLAADYRQQFVGQALPVLWEQQAPEGQWTGLTDTYIRVESRASRDLYNRITPTRLLAAGRDALIGEVLLPGSSGAGPSDEPDAAAASGCEV